MNDAQTANNAYKSCRHSLILIINLDCRHALYANVVANANLRITVDYISILGKNVNEALTNYFEYSIEYNDLGVDENIEPTWIVKAKDGRYEMILSIDKIIRTIFLFPIEDKLDGFDFKASRGRTFIIQKLGTPSRSGQEMMLPILGKKGGFDRYDYDDYSIHFEYAPGQQRIEKITLMLPEVVQDM